MLNPIRLISEVTMTVTITGRYLGNKKVELIHEPSGATLITDAPKDNLGDGSKFSPTDLVAAALGSCIITTIAIVAERDGIDVTNSHMSVTKHMSTSPRRIGELPVTLHLPKSLTVEQRAKLERTARTCPVHHSLHGDIKADITFTYDV